MIPADLRERLVEVAGLARFVLATDFDGTLSPFVIDPMTARPVEGAMDVLAAATDLDGVNVAIVSGRDIDTLRELTNAPDTVDLIGSHGAQTSRDLSRDLLDDDARFRLVEVEAALAGVRHQFPDARIERKPASVALHTRGLADYVADAALATAAKAGDRPGVHVLLGKSVVELGVLDMNKGVALRALADATDSAAVVYLGDDVTDERAFELLPADEGHVTVKVGAGETQAAYRVDAIDDVPEVFRLVVEARTAAGTA